MILVWVFLCSPVSIGLCVVSTTITAGVYPVWNKLHGSMHCITRLNRHYLINHHWFTSKHEAHAEFCGEITAFTQKNLRGFDTSVCEWRKVLLKFFKARQQSTEDGLTVAYQQHIYLVKDLSSSLFISIDWQLLNAVVKKQSGFFHIFSLLL